MCNCYLLGLRTLPATCQMVLFSATYSEAVMKFAGIVIPNAVIMRLKRSEESLDNIKQVRIRIPIKCFISKAVSKCWSDVHISFALVLVK